MTIDTVITVTDIHVSAASLDKRILMGTNPPK